MKKNNILTIILLVLISLVIVGCNEKPHEHSFVEGICECGEVDPNYVKHVHNFVEGVCECGEKDSNFVEHVHEYVDGVCECGLLNENFDIVTSSNNALTIKYSKVIYYTQKGLLAVEFTYPDDEINIKSLTSSIISIDDEATDNYILIGKKCGNGKVQVTSKYCGTFILNISVQENEEYSAIHEINISIEEEGPIYMGEVYHLNVEIVPSTYIDTFSFLKSDEYELNLETMEIMFKHSGTNTVSAFAEGHSVRVNQEFNVLINPDKESYEILFIGNSLTYVEDIPNIIYNMITADGAYVSYLQDTVGGSYLDSHKEKFDQFVSKHNFTHVVLQEQSAGSLTDFNRFKDAVLYYCEELTDREVEIILYQTWGYNYESGWNGMTKHEMTEKIKEAYDLVANEVGAKVTRSGEAFTIYETMYSDLPSLYKDVNHQSIYGAYLSACVHYCTITNKSAVLNTFEFEGIDSEISLIIRQIADSLVFGDK